MEMPGMEMGGDHGGHEAAGPVPPHVGFEATFPSPRLYKVFGQFQRGGKMVTADYTVRVR